MRKNVDMLNGPLVPSIIRFTIPVILTTMLQQLFNTADLIIVGQFCGSVKVAAVTAPASLTALMISLFTGLSLGAGLTVARAFGTRHEDEIHAAVHTALPTALIGGLLLSVVGAVFAPALLKLMNTPTGVLPLASVYMRVNFCGILFTVVYNFCAAILRATGDTKTPLLFLTISGVLKVGFNAFFIAVCKLDVFGVALAAVLSQAVAATLVVAALMRRNDACKLYLKKMRFRKGPFLNILRIGIPAGLQASLQSISNVFTASALNSFDSAAILAGNGASGNIEVVTDAIGVGFTQTAPNFIAQNLGAQQYDRIKKTYICCLLYSIIFIVCTSVPMYLFGKQLLGIYITDSPEAISYGLIRMRYCLLPTFLVSTMTVSTGALQGLGHATLATSISLICVCLLRIVWIVTLFQIPVFHTLDVLYLVGPVSWALTTAIEAPLFFFLLKKKIRAQEPCPAKQ